MKITEKELLKYFNANISMTILQASEQDLDCLVRKDDVGVNVWFSSSTKTTFLI